MRCDGKRPPDSIVKKVSASWHINVSHCPHVWRLNLINMGHVRTYAKRYHLQHVLTQALGPDVMKRTQLNKTQADQLESRLYLVFNWPSANGFKFMMLRDERGWRLLTSTMSCLCSPFRMFSMIKMLYVTLTLAACIRKFICRQRDKTSQPWRLKSLYDARCVTSTSPQLAS